VGDDPAGSTGCFRLPAPRPTPGLGAIISMRQPCGIIDFFEKERYNYYIMVFVYTIFVSSSLITRYCALNTAFRRGKL
jgi:hypothetical protein